MKLNSTHVVRLLVVLSGVIFGVSALREEWRLGILAVVVMVGAQIYGLVVATRDTSEQRLRELLKDDIKPKPRRPDPPA